MPTSPLALRCSTQEDSPCTKNPKQVSLPQTSGPESGLPLPRLKSFEPLKGVINSKSLQEDLATAIGDGLALGVDRLRGAKAKSKVRVLLTDGITTRERS